LLFVMPSHATGTSPTPSAADLLELWERSRELAPAVRHTVVGGWALGLWDASAASAADETFDRSDPPWGMLQRATLALRQAVFGPECTAICDCARCGAVLELSFSTTELGATTGSAAPETPTGPVTTGTLTLETPPLEIRWRLPTLRDAAAIAAAPDEAAARAAALAACVVSVRGPAGALAAAELPAAAVAALEAALAAADPETVRRLALACPECGYRWEPAFDAAAFFGSELEAWALRQLRDVHLLARAYGWSEAAILALSPARRRAYRELIAS
jgi:hypothetical protein